MVNFYFPPRGNLKLTLPQDVDIFCGLLYYMETSEMIRIPSIREELCSMIVARNELAWYAKNRGLLPQMLENHACNTCFARETCFIYHKVGHVLTAD